MSCLRAILICVLSTCAGAVNTASANGSQNPFVPDAPAPKAVASTATGQAAANITPISGATFSALEVVAITATHAIIRHLDENLQSRARSSGSATESTAQSASYRTSIVRNGGPLHLGGHHLTVRLSDEGESVMIYDGDLVVWEGFLSSPRTLIVEPDDGEGDFTPPPSAGYGVGESAQEGVSSSSTVSPAATGAAP